MTTETREIGPGMHRNLPFEQYLKLPYMSQSVLKQGAESMLHLKHAMDNQGNLEPTDAMTLGSALHVAFLEPELMPEKVVCWEGARRAGKEWEAFRELHAGKAILTPGMYAKLIGMVRQLRSHPRVREWTSRIEDVEVTCIGDICGVPWRGASTRSPTIRCGT